MFEKRLLERIMTEARQDQISVDPSALLDDVLGHLRDLFNVRQGSVPARPDYGMMDVNGVAHLFPEAIAILRAEIKRQIDTFEPRLSDVSVRHVPQPERPLGLVFAVTATLATPDRTQRVTVETTVGADGMVRVAP